MACSSANNFNPRDNPNMILPCQAMPCRGRFKSITIVTTLKEIKHTHEWKTLEKQSVIFCPLSSSRIDPSVEDNNIISRAAERCRSQISPLGKAAERFISLLQAWPGALGEVEGARTPLRNGLRCMGMQDLRIAEKYV